MFTKNSDRPTSQFLLSNRRPSNALLIIFGAIALVFLIGATPRLLQQFELNRIHKQLAIAIPEVNAIRVAAADRKTSLTLPGDLQPIQSIPIFARANGYLVKRFVDIGDIVKSGALLATIDTPELDEQVQQATANLRMAQANLTSALSDRENFAAQLFGADDAIQQARTNLEFSITESKRYESLASDGAVSYEQRDQILKQLSSDQAAIKIADHNRRALLAQVVSADARIAAGKQSVKSNQANLNQLKALQAFQKVLAPCNGVITKRFVDAGSLVAAGGSTGTTQLLTMANTDMLRIFVDVPQSDYRWIQNGDKAEILLQEFPEQSFVGTVTNIAGSLDSNTRTLQTEIRIDNSRHILKPGSYADVRFHYNNQEPPNVIPSNAAVTRDDGLYVAIVEDGKVRYRRIKVFHDYGDRLEVSEGLKPNDILLLDPPDRLTDGSVVKPLLPAGRVASTVGPKRKVP